jgi:hypothetical protein
MSSDLRKNLLASIEKRRKEGNKEKAKDSGAHAFENSYPPKVSAEYRAPFKTLVVPKVVQSPELQQETVRQHWIQRFDEREAAALEKAEKARRTVLHETARTKQRIGQPFPPANVPRQRNLDVVSILQGLPQPAERNLQLVPYYYCLTHIGQTFQEIKNIFNANGYRYHNSRGDANMCLFFSVINSWPGVPVELIDNKQAAQALKNAVVEKQRQKPDLFAHRYLGEFYVDPSQSSEPNTNYICERRETFKHIGAREFAENKEIDAISFPQYGLLECILVFLVLSSSEEAATLLRVQTFPTNEDLDQMGGPIVYIVNWEDVHYASFILQ